MQENLYWLVISDLVNLLSHRGVALTFLNDPNLVELWLELISYFQGMNLNVRKFGEHVQQEQPTYFSSFSAELEFCSSVMWSFLQHLKEPNQLHMSKKLIDSLQANLHKWIESLGANSTSYLFTKRPNFKHLSFHLPMHRYYSAFIYNAIHQQSAALNYLLSSETVATTSKSTAQPNLDLTLLTDILAHPLQLQIGFYEIHANMWVRNGMQMKGQAMTYVQNHFCTSFSDADLFLIQVLASIIDPNAFMKLFLERFHILNWLNDTVKARHHTVEQAAVSKQVVEPVVATDELLDEFELINYTNLLYPPIQSASENDADNLDESNQVAMLVGMFTVLAQIITIRPNLSFKSVLLTRTECVNLLCVFDRTYSQIEDSLPDMCSLSSSKKYIQPILKEVAEFLQPSLDSQSIGSLKQGRYKPRDSIWLNEYDPLYVMLRSVKRREFQESFDRYCQFVEKRMSKEKLKKNLWPPFRLPTSFAAASKHAELMTYLKETLTREELDAFEQEKSNHLRLEKELEIKSNILHAKSLHAILLTILYEVNWIKI